MFARSFRHDPAITWPLPPDGVDARVLGTFEVLVRESAASGWLWTLEDLAGAVSWVPAGSDEAMEAFLLATGEAVAPLSGELRSRYDAFWELIEAHRPREPHWYLDFLAVDAGRRGEGLGVTLVEHGLARARAEGVPAFLMTTHRDNIAFYERRGFSTAEEVDVPDGGPHLWFMRWETAAGSRPSPG